MGMGPPAHMPAVGGEQPDAKRAKGETGLVPEDMFAAQHPGNITVKINVPKEEENGKFNFNGQTILLRDVAIRSTVKVLKDMLQVAWPSSPTPPLKCPPPPLVPTSNRSTGTFLKDPVQAARPFLLFIYLFLKANSAHLCRLLMAYKLLKHSMKNVRGNVLTCFLLVFGWSDKSRDELGCL